MNYRSVFETIVLKIQELLQSSDFLDAHRIENHFIRKRLLSMYHVVLFLIYSTKQKMDTNIGNFRFDLFNLDFPKKISKQALSKARQGIHPALFLSFFELSVDVFYNHISRKKYWRGKFSLFAIDGSKLSLPPSPSNFEVFGHRFYKKNPKREWSEGLASIAYDVCNDYIVHGLLWNGLSSERAMAKEHFSVIEKRNLLKNAIFIFDRGYYSEEMFRLFYEKDCFCLMRLKESLKIVKTCKGRSLSTVLPGNPKKGTKDIPIRVISVDLGNGTTEYLATNIPEEEIPLDCYKELYFKRWPIELKYNEIKNQHLLEEFTGKTSISVLQEFFLNLLMSNLASLVKAEADETIANSANSDNKYEYQANRAYIIGRLKKVFPHVMAGMRPIDTLFDIFDEVITVKSQIQPGRSCPRTKKSRKNERKHFANRKRAV